MGGNVDQAEQTAGSRETGIDFETTGAKENPYSIPAGDIKTILSNARWLTLKCERPVFIEFQGGVFAVDEDLNITPFRTNSDFPSVEHKMEVMTRAADDIRREWAEKKEPTTAPKLKIDTASKISRIVHALKSIGRKKS